MYKYIPGHFLFLWLEIILLIINVISLMQKSEVMYNRATVMTDLRYLSYPVIFVLLIFSLLMAGCSDDENEEQPPAPDVPDYSTIVVKDIQNIPADFTFDRVEVKMTGVDWQVIETLSFPYENGQIIMALPTSFSSEKLQIVDRRNGMSGYWTGTSDDADALVATLGDFFVFNGDKRVGRIAISNWSGKGALIVAVALLWRDAQILPPTLSRLAHLSFFWMIVLALAVELFWFAQALPWGRAAWGSGLMMAAGGLLIFLVYQAVQRKLWPFRIWPALYSVQAMVPVALVLVGLLVLTNLQDGVVYRQTYLPLLNPLEEGAAFALLGLIMFYRASERYFPVQLSVCRPWPVVALMALGFWWLNGLLLRALSWYGEVAWNVHALWDSRLIQTCFALFWMLTALVVMLQATRRRSRQEWLCGAVLLGIVIIKLMLVDSAGGGGLARAVAFIGVAILVLIIGYFSPLPPKAGEEK